MQNHINYTEILHTHTHTIKPEYIDRMGHMNVMYYTHIFNMATIGFFEEFGFGIPYFDQHPSGSMALEQNTRYLNEVKQGEEVKLFTRALNRGRSSIHFIHFMRRERDGILAATMELITIHIDMRTRKSAPFPATVADQYDALLQKHQALTWDAPLCGSMAIRTKST